MKDARKSSFKTSMLNLVKAANHYYADNQLDITSPIAFDFIRGGVSEAGEELSFKGTKPKTGRLIINVDGEITLQDVSDGNYYANYNSSSDDDVIVTEDNEILTRDELTEAVKALQDENKKIKEQLSSTTTIANTANTTANQLANTRLDKTYPVGSIYISYSNTNPASLFGGTWVNYGSGRMLKGISSGTAGSTGGASSVTLTASNLPSHTHSIPVLSGSTNTAGAHDNHVNQTGGTYYMPITTVVKYQNPRPYKLMYGNEAEIATKTDGNHSHTISTNASTTGATGSASAINITNPYITVYMWRRTA